MKKADTTEIGGAMPETETKDRQIVAAQPDESVAVMGMIAKAASDPAFDVVKLEKLMDLQERLLSRQAKQQFATDFVQMKPQLPLVIRLHKNTQTNSKYSKLEDINQKIDPVLAQYGFGTSHKVVAQTDKQVTVCVELWHRGGHVESTTLSMPLDDCGIAGKVNKTLPHAISSTIMYLRRVGECALLNISTGDDKDGNGQQQPQQAEPITTEQAADIDTRARAISETYLAKFLKWLNVASAIEIKTSDYKRAIEALAEAEKKKAEKSGQKAKESGA